MFESANPLDVIGVKDAIKHCFSSVFQELNLSTEAWYQTAKLDSLSRDEYADFLTRRVGLFPLFGTGRSVLVTDSYVQVAVSCDPEFPF